MIVYKTTNLINGKIYVGYDTRNRPSYLGSGVFYKRAEKKYGKENFRKAIIDIDDDLKMLCLKEIFWIDFYDARNPEIGYNIDPGGKGFHGKHSEEAKLKMRRPKSEQAKQNISRSRIISGVAKGKNNPFYGAHHTNKTKTQIGLSSKERNAGEGNPMFGKCHSEETLLKMSLIKKGKKPSEETRKKLSLSKIGNKNCVGRVPWNKGKKLEFAKREFEK